MTSNNTSLFTVKTTVSVKMRHETGDEVFVSTGIEAHHVSEEDLDSRRDFIGEFADSWIKERTDALGSAAFGNYSEDDPTPDEEDPDETDSDLTEEAVGAMKKAELDALIEEHGLDIDTSMKIADKRAAIIEALFGEEDPDEEDPEEEDPEEEDPEEDPGEFEPYTDEELSAMKLTELQEIAQEWELEVTVKKAADLKAKKAAYIKAIKDRQEEESEE